MLKLPVNSVKHSIESKGFVFGASATGYGYQVHCKKCGNEASLQHDPAMRKMTVSCKHCNIAASFKRSVTFTINNSKLGPAVFLRAARHKVYKWLMHFVSPRQ